MVITSIPEEDVAKVAGILVDSATRAIGLTYVGRYDYYTSVSRTNAISRTNADDNVAQLQRQTEIMEIALASIRDHFHRECAGLKRQRNAFLPIHKLPTEIFTSILFRDIRHHYRSRANSPEDVKPRRQELAGVCHRWLTTIPASPLLWADVYFDDNSEWKTALRLSQTAPLRIHCDDRTGFRPTATMEFLQNAGLSADRVQAFWVSIRLIWRPEDEMKWISGSMPALKDIAVHLTGPGLPRSTLAITGTQPLRHTSLKFACLPWDSPQLSHLESLELFNLSSESFEQLGKMLSASPQLERLAIRSVELVAGTDITTGPITIPGLRSLYIGLVEDNVYRWVTGVLKVEVDWRLFESTETSPNLHALIDRVLINRRRIHINNEIQDGYVVVGEGEAHQVYDRLPWFYSKSAPSLGIVLRAEDPILAMRAIANFIGLSGTAAQIHLYADGAEPPEEYEPPATSVCPTDVLDFLPHLYLINVYGSDDALAFLRHLTLVRHGEDGKPSNACPKLSILDLSPVQDIGWEDIQAGRGRVNKIQRIRLPEILGSDSDDGKTESDHLPDDPENIVLASDEDDW